MLIAYISGTTGKEYSGIDPLCGRARGALLTCVLGIFVLKPNGQRVHRLLLDVNAKRMKNSCFAFPYVIKSLVSSCANRDCYKKCKPT